MGLQKHKKKYLFIPDDIIELQMFQGCQNWSWISQGVLGSNFIALPGNPGGWAIQLYRTENYWSRGVRVYVCTCEASCTAVHECTAACQIRESLRMISVCVQLI